MNISLLSLFCIIILFPPPFLSHIIKWQETNQVSRETAGLFFAYLLNTFREHISRKMCCHESALLGAKIRAKVPS